MALPITAPSRLVSGRTRYRRGGVSANGGYARNPRRVRLPAQNVHYRITGIKKITLIGLAVFFDLLPLSGLILGGTFLALGIASGSADIAACFGLDSGNWLQNAFNFTLRAGTVGGLAHSATCIAANAPGALVSMGAGGILLLSMPATYGIISLFSVVIAGFVMPATFALFGYRAIGVGMKKMGINIITFVMEALPLLNLFPTITITTLAHIHLSQVEDRARSKKHRAQ
jgi:hypothetical protein